MNINIIVTKYINTNNTHKITPAKFCESLRIGKMCMCSYFDLN